VTIAVAVDGSSASDAALDYAVDLARRDGKRLAGVFVIDSEWADFIGNDWQSSRNARQGFLDYILEQQKAQAGAAEEQFAQATRGLEESSFSILIGDPPQALMDLMRGDDAEMLVLGRAVFQVCGRPSLKSLSRTLTKKVQKPVVVCP
jgi:nucleotide-binding universal stress UspA family protein